MLNRLRKSVFELLEKNPPPNALSQKIRLIIIGLIFLNVIAVIVETIPAVHERYGSVFYLFEFISVIIFTAEYLARIWVCAENPKYSGFTGRIRYALTPFLMIDLLAIIPFYLPLFFVLDLRFMRALRLVRIFRILKLGRYSSSMAMMGNIIRNKKEELLITLFTLFILLTMASSLMYFFENEAQPQAFSSIPDAMWWGLITLTTVGYGDIYPITAGGKVLGGFLAILGVGLFALPAAILASSFAEEVKKSNKGGKFCPHCGKNILN